jgi:hypothetical protein
LADAVLTVLITLQQAAVETHVVRMNQILHLPPWLCGLIIVGAFVALALTGLPLFQFITGGRLRLTEEMNNDIIFFASAISVFYSLTVGLIAVGVWTTYSNVEDIVSAEASSIACMYRDSGGYPEPVRSLLRGQIRDYTDFVIKVAWPAQAKGDSSDEGTHRLNELEQTLVRFEPATTGQEILHAETLHQCNELASWRRKRLNAIGGGLPSVMWSVILVGAALSIGVTYLLQIERIVQFVLTGFLAMFIGLVVFVIASLDRPLSGPLSIESHPYQLVLDRLINLGEKPQ